MLLGFVYLLCWLLMQVNVSRLEREFFLAESEQAVAALRLIARDFGMYAEPWAYWDESWRFSRTRSSEFVRENLSPESMATARIGFIAFHHPDRGVYFQRAVDIERSEEAPIDPALDAALAPGGPLLEALSSATPREGLLTTPSGAYVAAIRPILRSNRRGEPNGAMLFVRPLPAHRLLRGSLSAHSSMRLWSRGDPALPDDVRRFLNDPRCATTVLCEQDRGAMSGYFLYRDLFDRPTLVGRLDLPCRMSSAAAWVRTQLLIGLLGAGGIFGLWLRHLLRRVVLKRLTKLRDGVQKLRRTGDLTLRLDVGGDDELSEVSHAINRLTQDLHAAHEALEDARLRAETAAETKSRFLANMSHEIRTPLNGVLGFAKLLESDEGQATPAERREWISTICSCSEHLLTLVNDVLDFSKIEAGRLECEHVRCDIQAVIAETVGLMSFRAREKHLTLEVVNAEIAPRNALSDATRLRQILTNLLTNALKFTQTGGITINCASVPDRPTMLRIDVTDTGCGIHPSKLDVIFDPFVQADTSVTRKFGGTGLGLAISRQLARAMGGDLVVQSRLGEGSTFTLTIDVGEPCDVSAPAARGTIATPPAKAPSEVPTRLRGRVLLVDDGETNRMLIRLILRRAGLTVEEAENGRVGVERATRESFDVILMDMQMPVMDGYAATHTLRRVGYDKPIIALTAHALPRDQARCRSVGCSGYLSKPIDQDLLLRTIATALQNSGCPQGDGSESDACAAGATSALAAADAPAPSAEPSEGTPLAPPTDLLEIAACESATDSAPPSPPERALAPVECALPLDDPEFLEIATEFVDRLAQQLSAMEEAAAHSDLNRLAELAHWLKGAGGTAGFHAFTEPARKLEAEARAAALGASRQCLRELRALHACIQLPNGPAAAPPATQ
jgi:signal transduction histidine kinase/CheY-like chemotaxis protein